MRPDNDPTLLLEPRLLTLFAMLYNTRHVSRVAEELGQTQSTVSAWLARLRAHFDDPLFVRTARGMVPTPRADSLVEPVREALQSLRRVSTPSDKFIPGEASWQFRICMTDASHITLLPRLLKRLRVEAPRIRIKARPIDDATARDLELGHADLALGIIPGLESGFYQQTFYEQDFICLVSKDHPQIQSGLDLNTYLNAAHVEVLSGKSHELLKDSLKVNGIQRNVMLQLPGFLGLGIIVAETDLVATVPRQIGSTLAKNGNLQALECPLKIPEFTVKQYWHARMHHDSANRWLRQTCASLYMNG